MYKVTYSIGKINRYMALKFSITLRNSKGVDSIKKENFNGNQYLFIRGLYPTLTIELADDVKDSGTHTWSTGRLVSFNRFQAISFIESGKLLLKKFYDLKDLFGYVDGKLVVNKDLAWQNREVFQTEYGKAVMVMPAVVNESVDSNVQYEGVSFMINELSNYAMLTYDEFKALISYIEGLDFDSLGMQLLNSALLMRNIKSSPQPYVMANSSNKDEELNTEVTDEEKQSKSPDENIQWRNIQNTPQIPKI